MQFEPFFIHAVEKILLILGWKPPRSSHSFKAVYKSNEHSSQSSKPTSTFIGWEGKRPKFKKPTLPPQQHHGFAEESSNINVTDPFEVSQVASSSFADTI